MEKFTSEGRLKRIRELQVKAMNIELEIFATPSTLSPEEHETPESLISRITTGLVNKKDEQSKMFQEIRGFIKIAYGTESEYFQSVNNIQFYNESLIEIMKTGEPATARWMMAKEQLMRLLGNIIAEENEVIKKGIDSKYKLIPIKYVFVVFAFITTNIAIWASPEIIYHLLFDPTELFAVRLCLSVTVAFVLLIIIDPLRWKGLVLGAIVPIMIALIPFLKKVTLGESTEQPVDTIQLNKRDAPAPKPDTSTMEH